VYQLNLNLSPLQRQLLVPGSEFTAVEIINLEIGQITDANNNYKDFTIYDHRNINAQLAAYIEKTNWQAI
jgi:hypothetical protein